MPLTKKTSAAMEINLCRETNYFGTTVMHLDRYREGLARPCESIQDLYLYEPISIHQCYRK